MSKTKSLANVLTGKTSCKKIREFFSSELPNAQKRAQELVELVTSQRH